VIEKWQQKEKRRKRRGEVVLVDTTDEEESLDREVNNILDDRDESESGITNSNIQEVGMIHRQDKKSDQKRPWNDLHDRS